MVTVPVPALPVEAETEATDGLEPDDWVEVAAETPDPPVVTLPVPEVPALTVEPVEMAVEAVDLPE